MVLVKKRLVVSILLTFFICSIASTFAAENAKFIAYQNEAYNFKMDYPEGWTRVTEGFMITAATFYAKPESVSDFSARIDVSVWDVSKYPKVTLDEDEKGSILAWEKTVADFQLISKEKCLLSGDPAIIYIYDGKEGTHNFRRTEAHILHNHTLYMIVFATEKSQLDKYQEVGERIINSFMIY